MKLTSFTDYSLRVLIYLAAEPRQRATVADIAAAFAISQNHLTKVVHFLGRAGLLSTLRGRNGGLALARPARAIGIGEVIRLAEGEAMPAECFEPGNHACAIGSVCRLRGVLQEASAAFQAVLDGYTLQDLVQNPQALASVLFDARAVPLHPVGTSPIRNP